MTRSCRFLLRPRTILLLSATFVAALVLIAFWLTMPQPHATINEVTFAQIREDMTREEVETLLGGPPRSESAQMGWHNDTVKERWGRWIVPLVLRSLAFPNPNAPQEMRDFAIMKNKGADFYEDGHYVASWHHDLVSVTVVFEEGTDRVKGAGLWVPSPKTWRAYPPMRWFLK